MTAMKWMLWILALLAGTRTAHGQQAAIEPQVQPQVVSRPVRDGQVTTVFLTPRYVTTVRMPEPISSVVVGDPASFSAEHSDREPNLVFVKPITAKPAQTNLLISTTRGLQATLLLVTRGEPKEDGQPAVDFLMRYKPAGQFMIQPADYPSVMIAQTTNVAGAATGFSGRVRPFRSYQPQRRVTVIQQRDQHRSRWLRRVHRRRRIMGGEETAGLRRYVGIRRVLRPGV